MIGIRLTIDEVAAQLHKSERWLKAWLRKHPHDAAGEPYYTPVGRTKLFHRSDVARIEASLRGELACSRLDRRAQGARHTSKSVAPTSASVWDEAARLTKDMSLSPSSARSRSASSSTAATPRQRFGTIKGGRS